MTDPGPHTVPIVSTPCPFGPFASTRRSLRMMQWPIVTLLMVTRGFLGCDEQLPPRADPTELLSGRLSATYSLSPTENVMSVHFTITNTYDEVIEGTASLDGSLSLTLIRDPSVTRTFDLALLGIGFAGNYNPTTKFLSIVPGDSITFLAKYYFVDDSGRHLTQVLEYRPDITCPAREVSPRLAFVIRADVELFPRIAPVVPSPILFDMCHVTAWVNPNSCPPVVGPLSACSDIPR